MKSAINIVFSLFIFFVFFIVLFIIFILYQLALNSLWPIKVYMVGWPSLDLFYENLKVPFFSSLITLLAGVIIYFRVKSVKTYFLAVFFVSGIIFPVFVWFYFPHYNLKGYNACVAFDPKKRKMTKAEFGHLYGEPEYSDQYDYLFNADSMKYSNHRSGPTYCVLLIDKDGRIYDVKEEITLD